MHWVNHLRIPDTVSHWYMCRLDNVRNWSLAWAEIQEECEQFLSFIPKPPPSATTANCFICYNYSSRDILMQELSVLSYSKCHFRLRKHLPPGSELRGHSYIEQAVKCNETWFNLVIGWALAWWKHEFTDIKRDEFAHEFPPFTKFIQSLIKRHRWKFSTLTT